MREACREYKVWLDAGIAPSAISVNVSAVQFKTALDLEKDIAAILLESGLPPHRLELELTETVLMDVSREHNDVLVRLRQAGVRFAIDDFGTGYSSLAYLSTYPFAQVKIDQSFAREVHTSEAPKAVIEAVCQLARRLQMNVVVEGIETEQQRIAVQLLGAHRAQGFLFGRPESLSTIKSRSGNRSVA